MEKFDQLKVDGMRFAEKHCHRLHLGAIQFLQGAKFLAKKERIMETGPLPAYGLSHPHYDHLPIGS